MVPVVLSILPGPTLQRRQASDFAVDGDCRSQGALQESIVQQDYCGQYQARRCKDFTSDSANALALGPGDYRRCSRQASQTKVVNAYRTNLQNYTLLRSSLSLIIGCGESGFCLELLESRVALVNSFSWMVPPHSAAASPFVR